jgi:hypothetical protein
VEMSTSRFLRKNCSYPPRELLATPCRLYLKINVLISFISRECWFCKYPVRFSSIGSCGFDCRFLLPLCLMFRFTSCI